MTLTEAIEKDTEIECASERERRQVIKILKAANVAYGCSFTTVQSYSLFSNIWIDAETKTWWECLRQHRAVARKITATTFIQANKG